MSALSLAVLIEQQAGIETVLHYACRDRNLLGMQSDLLGAHAMGVRNVLLVTGDPPKLGDYPKATGVFDVDSIGLTNVVARLNRGLDIGGQPIGRPTGFHIGVAVNPTALDLEQEYRRFAYKVEAGAEFAVTQLGRSTSRRSTAFLARIAPYAHPHHRGRLAVRERASTPSSWPTRCRACACRSAVLARMRAAATPEAALDEGVAIAREIAAAVRDRVQGIQVATAVRARRGGARRARRACDDGAAAPAAGLRFPALLPCPRPTAGI